MKLLQAPWRWKFVSRKRGSNDSCVFCDASEKKGFDSLVLFRGDHYFVILNKYPYTTGHLMVVPWQHVDEPGKLPPDSAGEMWSLINRSMEILKKRFEPQGFNLGANIGAAAGAGIEDHFHMHVVPRWRGDSNFMDITGKTRVHSSDLRSIYDLLIEDFSK